MHIPSLSLIFLPPLATHYSIFSTLQTQLIRNGYPGLNFKWVLAHSPPFLCKNRHWRSAELFPWAEALFANIPRMHKACLLKILRRWRKWSTGYEEIGLSPSSSSATRRNRRRRRNAVTVVVGKEKEIFKVEPQILDCGLFQPLMEKASVRRISREDHGRKKSCNDFIFLDCDAILFDHMLWLVHNDDPCLRNFNLEILMEFYSEEHCSTIHL